MMKVTLALSAAAVALAQEAPAAAEPTLIRRAPYNGGLYGHGLYNRGFNSFYNRPAGAVRVVSGEAAAPAPIWNANRAVFNAPATVNPFAGRQPSLSLFGSNPVSPPAGMTGDHLAHWYDMQIADAVVAEQNAAFLTIGTDRTTNMGDSEDDLLDRYDILAKLEKDAAHRAAAHAHHQSADEGSALDLKEAELEKAASDLVFVNINKQLTNDDYDTLDNLDWMIDDIDRQAALLDLQEAQEDGDAAEIAKAQAWADSWSIISYSNLIDLQQSNPNKNQRDIIAKGDKLEDMLDVIDDTDGFNEATADLPEAEAALRANPTSRQHQLEYELAKQELTLATIDFIGSMGNFFEGFELDRNEARRHELVEALADLEVAKLERELVHLGAPVGFHMHDGNMVAGSD